VAPIAILRDHMPQGIHTPTSEVTARTVKRMCEHIADGLKDPLVHQLAQRLNATAPDATLARIWLWTKNRVKFVSDESLTRRLLNEGDNFELLIAPSVLLRSSKPQGDCDDFTMLVAALARSLGFPVRIVTLVCDRRRPGEYSHVYCAAELPNGVWCPMDASHGRYPGWQVPSYDVARRTEWNLDGRIVSDERFPDVERSHRARTNETPPEVGMNGVLDNMPTFATGLPMIGTIDLKNPVEWIVWGGALASATLLKEPMHRVAGVAGFLTGRFLLQQIGANV